VSKVHFAFRTTFNGSDGKKHMIKLQNLKKIQAIKIHLLHSECVLAEISKMLGQDCFGTNITGEGIVGTF
jgi:hypothetical protein